MLTLLVLIVACQPSPRGQQAEPLVDETIEEEVLDTTYYGVCGDGTSMHSLELITNDGDTLIYSYNTGEDQVTRGGLMVGDRVAVLRGIDEYGDSCASLIVNLTSLLGHWTSLDKNFEIQEGGVVQSNVATESKSWTSWKIMNGQLLFDRDTFDIVALNADSLFLENDNGIFVYKRLQ